MKTKRLQAIGIVCEFNPLHNGHLYFINTVKKRYPDHAIILVLNGYFLQRGEVSIISKEDKTRLSLLYGVDVVLEHPVFFGTQSADLFASSAVQILSTFKIEKLVFGSECNDKKLLHKIASTQLNDPEFDSRVQKYLKDGCNYPCAVSAASNTDGFVFTPNDILGICYIKGLMNLRKYIDFETVKRTNDYHDNDLIEDVVSASNIRAKIKNNQNIKRFIPDKVYDHILNVNQKKLFEILKVKILTDSYLKDYLDVQSGIDYRLKDLVKECNNLDDFIKGIKYKRITFNRVNRMLIHILLGMTKKDARRIKVQNVRILGFTEKGQKYIKSIRKNLKNKHLPDKTSKLYNYEIKAALIYEILTGASVYEFEKCNKPIFFSE